MQETPAPADVHSFQTPAHLEAWLEANHQTAPGIWVRIFKKASGTPTVTWDDCVIAALRWGWIDSQRKALDDTSFLQRLTPRRPGSNWSRRNCEHAERLIAEGRMQPSGLAHVEAARHDGRWEQAYAGSADMTFPDDFLTALQNHPTAAQHFDTLDRRNRYAIYYRLQTAKRPETRQKRLTDMIAQLARGETFHASPAKRTEPAAPPGEKDDLIGTGQGC